jgi:hypothetical protein
MVHPSGTTDIISARCLIDVEEMMFNGAGEGSRTPTPKALDPKSSASASSATPAFFEMVSHTGLEPVTP